MNTVVCGYGEVGWVCLDELLEIGARVPLVVTHRDDPGERIWFRSVAERAREAGIRVVCPDDVNADDAVAEIAAARPGLLFSFYFRQLLSPRVLALPAVGALNMHGSLLPKYRGRAPVNWVLVHGEAETGVTLHYMDAKPDHGDVVAQRRVAIDRDDTALTLTRKIAAAARAVVRETYPLLVAGTALRRPQEHRASSYFGGRKPADGEIDWRRDAESIRNLVRAVTAPWPGAFAFFRGERLFVWRAETRPHGEVAAVGEIRLSGSGAPLVGTGAGALELIEVGCEADGHEDAPSWARRAGVVNGDRFELRSIASHPHPR
jgi:methionyl-tRNA formyltransferase